MSGRLDYWTKKRLPYENCYQITTIEQGLPFHGLGDRDIAPRADGVHV